MCVACLHFTGKVHPNRNVKNFNVGDIGKSMVTNVGDFDRTLSGGGFEISGYG